MNNNFLIFITLKKIYVNKNIIPASPTCLISSNTKKIRTLPSKSREQSRSYFPVRKKTNALLIKSHLHGLKFLSIFRTVCIKTPHKYHRRRTTTGELLFGKLFTTISVPKLRNRTQKKTLQKLFPQICLLFCNPDGVHSFTSLITQIIPNDNGQNLI